MYIYDWMNEEHLEKALKEYQDESVEIVNIDYKPAVQTGDNYTSRIFRVSVTIH